MSDYFSLLKINFNFSYSGTEDQCEPQPIPQLLLGHDKENVALSPFALKFWVNILKDIIVF